MEISMTTLEELSTFIDRSLDASPDATIQTFERFY